MGKIKIKDLPNELKFLAICNQISVGNHPNENVNLESGIFRNFKWMGSPQGGEFWSDVNNGKNLDVYKDKLTD